MKKYYILATSLLLLAFTLGGIRSFYTIPYPANALCTADYDMDGDFDILINFDRNYQLQFDKGGIYLLQNDGSGHFTFMDSIINSVGGSSWEITTDTIINKTFPDIIYASDSLYIISTDGTIYTERSFYIGENVSDFALGDIDGNGTLDVAFSSNLGRYWGIIYGQVNSSFSPPTYFNLNFPPTHIKCGKLNDDDNDDILVSGSHSTLFFSVDTGFIIQSLQHNSLKADFKDLDNDGDKDIITFSDIYAATLVYLYENKGNNIFDSVGFYRVPEGSSDFFVTDFNNDSLPDVLFLTHDFWNESLILYYNKGDFQLGDSLIIQVEDYGEARRFMYCADMDGNGYSDILLTRQVYDTTYAPSLLQIFFNDGNGHFVENPIESIDESKTINDLTLNCYPNPFHNNLHINYKIKETKKIAIDIYNMQGALIRTLQKETKSSGSYQTIWNGTDKNGKEVTNGTYLIRLQAGRHTLTRTVILNK